MLARRRRTTSFAVGVTALLVGCSMIVPDDVPAFRCTGSDPTSCPSGLVCGSAGVCVSPTTLIDGGEDVTAGDDGGEQEGGVDGPPGPSQLGGDCIVDGDCADGLLCGTSTLLTTAIVPANSKPICTKPCCRSADCAAGFICFPGGTGGNYCVAANKANRTPPPTGGRAGGQTCGDHDECRSGLCAAGKCVDTCCDPDQCAAGSTCRIATVSTHVGWACGAPNAGAELAAACSANSDCKNDNCVQPFSTGKRCTPPCCRSSDCTSLGFANNVCAYGQAGTDNLKWCYERNAAGKGTGQTCASNADCASRYCDAELGRCANVCCTTADCGSGETCRPSPGGTPFLRCVKDR